MQEEAVYDVVIIGGGPAGLTAAQYASRARLKTIILDKSATAGALAYSSRIENYPGLTKPLPGKELLDIMREQAIGFGAEYAEAFRADRASRAHHSIGRTMVRPQCGLRDARR